MPALLKTSAAMGTVELTGLEMMFTKARGQCFATAWHSPRTTAAEMGGAIQTLSHLQRARASFCAPGGGLAEGEGQGRGESHSRR